MGRGGAAGVADRAGAAAPVVETVTSERWATAQPQLSIVVSTYRRPRYLPGLLDALDAQDAGDHIEVIIIDNGSGDETWAALSARAQRTPLALCAARIEHNNGPAPGRNAAVQLARAPFLAFTDDDCIPHRAWAARMLAGLAGGERAIQGRTEPEAGVPRGPWDHTMTVRRPTELFETCNIAYRREDVIAAGGFRQLPGYIFNGKPFGGEDTMLGFDILRATGSELVFDAEAVVEHRIEPRSYRKWLKVRNGTSIFPALVRSVPEVRASLFLRIFLTARSAAFDLAVLSLVAAGVARTWWPLVGLLPYLWKLAPRRGQNLRGWAKRLIPLVIGDGATAFSLWRGSVRYRRPVL
jgi:glycosyltransferase involved in cell wall biosynthesis